MSHDEILLQTILDDPSDIDARLVYGDYLADLEDPRGEFIQCEVAADRLASWTPDYADLHYRARELELQHRKTWDEEIEHVIHRSQISQRPEEHDFRRLKYHYRRGFADHFEMDRLPSDFGPIRELIKTTPLRKISTSCNESLLHLREPEMGVLSQLALRGQLPQKRIRTAIFGNNSPLRLQSLRLYLSRLSTTSDHKFVLELSKSKALEHLTSFGCNVCSSDPETLKRLIKSPTFRHLQDLELTESAFGDAGMELISKSHLVKQLRSLNIKMCGIGDPGLAKFANAGPEMLRHIGIGWWYGKNPTAAGLEALFRSGALSSLEALDLRGLRTDKEVYTSLTTNPALARLLQINLSSTQLDDEKSRLLADGVHLRPTWLDLGSNRALSGRALMRLLHSNFVERVTYLNLEKFAHGGHKAADYIAKSRSLKNLRYLNLSDTGADRSLVAKLARSENAENLCELQLNHIDSLTDKEIDMLRDRSAFPRLRFLSILGCNLNSQRTKRLRNRFRKGLTSSEHPTGLRA